MVPGWSGGTAKMRSHSVPTLFPVRSRSVPSLEVNPGRKLRCSRCSENSAAPCTTEWVRRQTYQLRGTGEQWEHALKPSGCRWNRAGTRHGTGSATPAGTEWRGRRALTLVVRYDNTKDVIAGAAADGTKDAARLLSMPCSSRTNCGSSMHFRRNQRRQSRPRGGRLISSKSGCRG
jgi:hypothetical protein